MNKKIKISQSLMKGYAEYHQGNECGLAFKARYITKEVAFPSSEAMLLGNYFEYHATGAIPRNGGIPNGEITKQGKLTAPYERAFASASFCKALFRHFDINILETNYLLEDEKEKGYLDVFAEWNGQKVIIDLKYTSLIEDKWSDFGWHIDFLPQKENILIQGVSYKKLAKSVLGIDNIPFYFWVFDAKNPLNVRIIEEIVDDNRFEQHQQAVDNTLYMIEQNIKSDNWIPRPNLLRCASCPLLATCEHAVNHPTIEQVYF